jgi:hypothetical protein
VAKKDIAIGSSLPSGQGKESNDMVKKDLLPGGKEESTKTGKEGLLHNS